MCFDLSLLFPLSVVSFLSEVSGGCVLDIQQTSPGLQMTSLVLDCSTNTLSRHTSFFNHPSSQTFSKTYFICPHIFLHSFSGASESTDNPTSSTVSISLLCHSPAPAFLEHVKVFYFTFRHSKFIITKMSPCLLCN